MSNMIHIPVEVVRKGIQATWIYAYLAILELDGKHVPERQLAEQLCIGRTQLRNVLNCVKRTNANQERTNANQSGADRQQVTEANEPQTNQREPRTNQAEEKETSSPLTIPTTKEKEDNPKAKEKTTCSSTKESERVKNERLLRNREEAFRVELGAYEETYGKVMIDEFFDYWREPNKSMSRMRWENERTWNLNLRLQRWARTSFGKHSATDVGRVRIDNSTDKDFGGW